jgi:hypothetical protein
MNASNGSSVSNGRHQAEIASLDPSVLARSCNGRGVKILRRRQHVSTRLL